MLRTLLLAAACLMAANAWGGQIHGRVMNPQGTGLAGARITVANSAGQLLGEATTGGDGSYAVPSLEPGRYVVTVSGSPAAGAAAVTLRREVAVDGGAEPVRADFQLQAPAAPSASIAAEERNPNIFVYKIDVNDLRNRLTVGRGPDPTYTPQFSSDLNYFGAEYGAPLYSYEILRPRALVRAWRVSLYGLHQNSELNARNFFNVGPLLASRSTSYSATANGPLFSEATGLLLQYGQTLTSGAVNGNVQSPRDDQRASTAADPARRAYINSLLRAYPAESPNLGETRLNSNASRSVDAKDALARIDHRWNENTSLALRYTVSDYTEDPFQIVTGQNPQTDVRTQAAYIAATHTFSPAMSGRFAFNFDRTGASLQPTKRFTDLFAGLGVALVPDIDFASDEFTDIGPLPQFPRERAQNRYQMYADLTRSAGAHTWKLGWSSTRVQLNDLQSDNSRGLFRFSAERIVGCSSKTNPTEIDNFLDGCASLFNVSIGNFYRGFRNWEHFGYVEDQIKLRPNFTLTAGVRYELVTSPVEVNSLTDTGYDADRNNFAPRVAFAWNHGRTVVRGAYGMSYAQIMGVTYGMTRFNAPQVRVFQVNAPDLLNPLGGNLAQRPETVYQLSPDLIPAYSHHYTLGIERAAPWGLTLRAGYVGTRTFHLLTQQVYNRAQPSTVFANTTATVQQRRPDQRFADVIVIESNANAYYDALVFSADKRLSSGLTFRTLYGFGKNIDTGGDFTNTATGVEKPPETGTPTCEACEQVSDHKSISLFDTTHALSISYSYTLPFAANANGLVKNLFSGWQVSGVTVLQSGTPYHVHTGGDGPGLGNVDGWGQDRPNLRDPSVLGKSYDDPDTSVRLMGADTCIPRNQPDASGVAVPYVRCRFFDTNVPVGGRGNIGFNVFRKDATHNWNMAIGRTFPLPGGRERTAQFRAEFINLFNHAQFDKPNVQVSGAIFGQITNTANKGRQVQFSLRLNF